MKKIFALLALALATSASAAFTPTQLAQLVKNPTPFKPTNKSSAQINTNTPVTSWRWGTGIAPSVALKRMNGTPNWSLELSGKTYKVAALAPSKKRLFTVADPVMGGVVTGYGVTSGPFKGNYLLETRYGDGSGSTDLLTKGFGVRAGLGSEFGAQSESKMYGYPVYGYFEENSFFCGVSGITCP